MPSSLVASVTVQAPSERLAINSGVRLETSDAYHPHSYLPRSDWRTPNVDELAVLTSLTTEDYSRTIRVLPLPAEITKICQDMGLDAVADRRSIRQQFAANRPLFEQFELLLNNFLLSMEMVDETAPVIHAFPIATHGLPSITRRYLNGSEEYRFCGLHVDCDSGASVVACTSARNRISINLTGEPRHLFFINIALDELNARYAEQFGLPTNIDDRNSLVQEFLAHNHTYPVVRLTVQPYEAYIAPTDNIIHEASTLGRTIEDVTLVALGKFKV